MENLDFLIKLLRTPSPSGGEQNFQKIWLEQVKRFSVVKTDQAGNAFGFVGKQCNVKVMLAGHGDEICMLVSHIDKNGFVYFTTAGRFHLEALNGLSVTILGKKSHINGVLCQKAQENDSAAKKLQDFFIDCGARSGSEMEKHISVGNYIVFNSDVTRLSNNLLAANAIDNKSGAFIVAEVLRKLSAKDLDYTVIGVSTTGEETNMRGAYFAGAGEKPNMAIACDVRFCTDLPGSRPEQSSDMHLGQGPSISTGGAVNEKVCRLIKQSAAELKIKLQTRPTPERTATDADTIQFTGSGVPVGVLSLPIRYMHRPFEVCSIDDLKAEIDILTRTLSNLNRKMILDYNFCPE